MSGLFFRVKRGQKWEDIEIEDLTSKERDEILDEKGAHSLILIIERLCQTLKGEPPF